MFNKATTQSIEVDVLCQFVPERSRPEQNYYFFSYTVRISNLGTQSVKLVSRHWFVTDAIGRTHQVKGDGVVGEQPYLEPGHSFQYTSYCPLATPTGGMIGTYQMTRNNGDKFNAQIPAFALYCPDVLN